MASSNSLGAISRVLLLAWLAVACQEPELVVGTWSCPVGPREQDDAGVSHSVTDPVPLPWSTDFERGFCDLYVAGGYCYAPDDKSSYEVVDTFARSGTQSVAFTIDTGPADDKGTGTRCVREGEMPDDAYYGAWYYVPEQHDELNNWNLLHFQGGIPGDCGSPPCIHNLWDVSIETDDDTGKLKLYALGKFPMSLLTQNDPATTVFVPVGSWFHVEFRWRRAMDDTGMVALYQDGKLLVSRSNFQTEDTSWGQWYVGNLAVSLSPPESTLYVDDISIRPAP